jgi:hypothetical protein
VNTSPIAINPMTALDFTAFNIRKFLSGGFDPQMSIGEPVKPVLYQEWMGNNRVYTFKSFSWLSGLSIQTVKICWTIFDFNAEDR